MLGRFLIVSGVFFAVITGGLMFVFLHAPRSGELFDKRGWSVLQGMDDPPPQSSSVVLVRREEFALLGFRGVGKPKFRTLGQPQWSWVLLNEHHADGDIKQGPEFGSYELPCSDLKQVERTVRDVDAYAMRYLRSICT